MATSLDPRSTDAAEGGRGRALLLFFTKPTSGPARRMDSLIAHVEARERRRLQVLRVDAEQHARLAAKLGVLEVPALVLVKNGRPVERLEGRTTGGTIDRMLDEHLLP